MGGRYAKVEQEGRKIDASYNPINPNGRAENCRDECDEHFGCHSFTYCPDEYEPDEKEGCFMYDKKVTKDDKFEKDTRGCETHFRECSGNNAMSLL